MQSDLKLISLDYNVLEMVETHKGVLVIELYILSFDEHAVNDDEYEDNNDDNDGENSRIDHSLRAMLRRVIRVMGRVMRVRMGMRRVMRQWRMIIKIEMQRELKRVEGVDVMVMRLMMMM
jgi:hypothetical protein